MNNYIHLRNLGSSSSGNSTLIWQGTEALLMDIGFSQRYMAERFESASIRLDDVKGVLITHLHSDHITQAMLNKVLRYHIPVYIHQNLYQNFLNRFKPKSLEFVNTYKDEAFRIGSFVVRGFEVPHDSYGGCYGYNVERDDKKITIATDMGFPENGLADNFKDSDLIVIESNHDPHMLETSNRPPDLIDRIKNIGHLSNAQCVDFLDDVFKRSEKLPKSVALAHLSEDCNLPDLAQKGVAKLLGRYNLETISLQVFKKNQDSDTLSI